MSDTITYPLILLCISQFAEFIYDSDFKHMHETHLSSMPWLPHTLLCYLQKYFQACTPAATRPRHLRAMINGDPIPSNLFKDAEFLLPKFMDLLRSSTLGDNMGMLATPPSSYLLFFPSPKRKFDTELKTPKGPKIAKVTENGFLKNTGEKKLPPHARMSVNPCYSFLVDGTCPQHNCCFFHGVPKGLYHP